MKGTCIRSCAEGKNRILWRGTGTGSHRYGTRTCWVAGTFDRKLIEVPGGEEMYCVIPVGHIEKVTLREKMLRSAVSKNVNLLQSA